jgi:predicted nucleic-acid-binding protein
MIGLDTNILVRVYADDPGNEAQVAAARAFLARSSEPVWLSLVVIMEAIWLLRRRFGADRAAITAFIRDLLDRDLFVIQERGSLEAALDSHVQRNLRFQDCLIEMLARRAGVTTTYTFDTDAARWAHFTLLDSGV